MVNKEPTYIMTIDINNDRKENLYIYDNASAGELAFEFCKNNNLDFSSMEYLIKEIERFRKIGLQTTIEEVKEENDPTERSFPQNTFTLRSFSNEIRDNKGEPEIIEDLYKNTEELLVYKKPLVKYNKHIQSNKGNNLFKEKENNNLFAYREQEIINSYRKRETKLSNHSVSTLNTNISNKFVLGKHNEQRSHSRNKTPHSIISSQTTKIRDHSKMNRESIRCPTKLGSSNHDSFSFSSNKIFEKIKLHSFKKIFKILDRDEDKCLSIYTLNTESLPNFIKSFLQPINNKIKNEFCTLSEKDFLTFCEVIYQNLTQIDKMEIINFGLKNKHTNSFSCDSLSKKKALNSLTFIHNKLYSKSVKI